MEQGGIPMEWVIGAEETTLWLWPDSPDPVTVRFPIRQWAKMEKAAEIEGYDSVEGYVTKVLRTDLEEHREKLAE